MQTILVPTDFSAAARNALSYAVAVANHFQSRITVLSTYKVYSNAGMLVSVEDHLKKEVAEEMLELLKTTEKQLENGASLNSAIINGDAASTIATYAAKHDYDLIIMGTTGASGLKEIFTGSTTNAVAKAATVPVLAIPASARFRAPQRIVLAVDDQAVSHERILEPVRTLAGWMGAHVYVFHQVADADSDGIDPSVTGYLDGIATTLHYELDPEDVHTSLATFLADNPADLLVMIHRTRGFFAGLFHRSVTAREVFHTHLPLLILHDEA